MVRRVDWDWVTRRNTLLWSVALVIVFVLGWYVGSVHSASIQTMATPVRITDSAYPLISPLVGVNLPSTDTFPELSRVQKDVQSIITDATRTGKAKDVGVYFRIPANAHSFGINADGQFIPGSLMKVPLMMDYFKLAETDPGVLLQKILYVQSSTDSLPNLLPPQLSPGNYSIERLIEVMIIDSDNVAKDVLLAHIGQTKLKEIFNEVHSNFLADPLSTVSPKSYIVFFARLYNAAFLNRAGSNHALDLLSHTTFTQGLVAGVPGGVMVAHKYGERGVYEDKKLTDVELHDCGIVYLPGTPYYLCIMTRGSSIDDLSALIRSISSSVYNDRASFAIKK